MIMERDQCCQSSDNHHDHREIHVNLVIIIRIMERDPRCQSSDNHHDHGERSMLSIWSYLHDHGKLSMLSI